MKKAIIVSSLLLLGAMGGLKAEEACGGGLLRDLLINSNLTQNQKSEVCKALIDKAGDWLDISVSQGDSTYDGTREIVQGFLDDILKDIVPQRVDGGQSIISQIQADKGDLTAGMVQSLMHDLNATPLEYVSTDSDEPAVVRIELFDQTGQECGVTALSNLLAFGKIMGRRHIKRRNNFAEMSANIFKSHGKKCLVKESLELKDIALGAKEMNFSQLYMVDSNSVINLLYSGPVIQNSREKLVEVEDDSNMSSYKVLLGDEGVGLRELIKSKQPLINILVHSTKKKYGAHSEHWTAAAVVNGDIIVFMDTVGNERGEPINETIKKALRYIATEVKKARE